MSTQKPLTLLRKLKAKGQDQHKLEPQGDKAVNRAIEHFTSSASVVVLR